MRHLKYFMLIAILFIGTLTIHAASPSRASYSLNDGWRFFFAEDPDAADADYVTLPHTWNIGAEEGGYLRTTANYMRDVHIPAEWQGNRLFMRFGGAQSVAELFVNGKYVGEHRGGFTAFTFEITDFVRYGAENHLRVIVSNNQRNDVLPLSSDMDLAGGIYRDVELMVMPENIISPLYYGSEGVLVEQHKISRDKAEGVVKVYLSTKNLDHTTLTVRFVGEDGYEVVSRTVKVSKISSDRAVEVPFEILNPQLWSPDKRTMYRVEVTLGDAKNPLDELVVFTGLRSVTVSDDNKLCINGVAVDVKGVSLPHDREGFGTAITHQHIDDDFATLRDMGANAVRSILGPHDGHLYDLCDKEGVLAWVDVPFSRYEYSFSDICYYPTAAFHDNGFEQLKEVIVQNYNHPSVVMWGIFSLVWQRGDDLMGYVGELNDMAHALDMSRPTVSCSNSDGAINFITDLVVLRQNVGWMKGSIEDVDIWCEQLSSNKTWSSLRCGVAYGEAGVRGHNTERVERASRDTRHLPERRQTDMHERYIEQIDEAGIFWGVWLDNMFDYASTRRTYGMNLAGMVEYNHAYKKDAYYLYRARWNAAEPTLRIADKSWCERRDTLQSVDVYSSVGEPIVLVEGDTIPTRRVGEAHYRADSVVVRGTKTIRATDASGRYNDSATIKVVR